MASGLKKPERGSSSAFDLAQIRGEVAIALQDAVPNEAQLLRALEQVEALLANSRSELAALMQELEGLVERRPSRPVLIPIRARILTRRGPVGQ